MFTTYTAALLLPLLPLLPLSLASPLPEHLAPIRRAVDVGGRNANGGYIVAIKSNTVDPNNRARWLSNVLAEQGVTLDDATTRSLKLKWSEDVFNGIAGTFSTDALTALQKQPEVAWVQEDIEMHITALVQQTNAPWGLARLSSGTNPVSGNPNDLNFNYIFDDTAGTGTEAYIIDTGCRATHQDFQGRATLLASFIDGEPDDGNGHGTHVAGTIGGSVFGVAKSSALFCIKTMANNGSGATSNIISGINLAAQAANQSGKPSVISMSLGGPVNQALDDAVSNVISQGIPFIIAAGNGDAQGNPEDANTISPARVPEAITVGATTIDDTFASFSNFGDKVDILAPGVDIISAGFDADDAVAQLSGTSMACPHVSGLALLLMGQEGKLSPSALSDRLKALAISNAIGGVFPNTANLLASNGVQV